MAPPLRPRCCWCLLLLVLSIFWSPVWAFSEVLLWKNPIAQQQQGGHDVNNSKNMGVVRIRHHSQQMRRRKRLSLPSTTSTTLRSIRWDDPDADAVQPRRLPEPAGTLSRRQSFGSTAAAAALVLLASTTTTTTTTVLVPPAVAADELTVIQLPSGLKYIDLQPGTGRSPSYGNFCTISYQAYIKLPAGGGNNNNSQPQRYDSSNAYLIKHGNGRTIAGLDEGLHTMKVGGVRRMLIPPKLGFVDAGLGPLPDAPWNRYRLNQLLDQMVTLVGGTVIYEVTLKQVVEDEADQGYYSDDSLTPEEFATLRENLRIQGNEKLRRQAAENSLGVTGQERML